MSRGWAAHVWAGTSIDRFIACLLVLYIVKQLVFVVAFQPFTGHDEVAHYSYIEVLATEGRVPQLPELERWQDVARSRGDTGFDQIPTKLYPYCRYAIVGWHCEPHDRQWAQTPPRMVTYLGELYPTGFQYTANHPPLYYLAMVPVYWLAERWSLETQQYLLRLAAIPFGLLTVWLAFRTTRELFPRDGFLQVTVPAVVAFQPQISYEAAMVNNDIAAVAMFSWVVFLIVRGIRARFPISTCVWLGVALGVAVLTKSTSLIGAPIIAVAIILSLGWRSVREWLLRGLAVLVPALAVVAPWYAFMFRTYGNLDALAQIQALQFWNRSAGGFAELLFDREFLIMRFRETWGEFGWRLMPLRTSLLWVIAVPILVSLAGLCWYVFRARWRSSGSVPSSVTAPQRYQTISLIVLALTCVAGYLAVVQFGTQFQLTQARYFFPVVNAAVLLTMLGLRAIIPASVHRYAQGVIFGAMLVLNIVIFVQYVFPQFVSV
jgi:4-amino-4-deoxy-L-arabinose transferase-like glycosyltransferase